MPCTCETPPTTAATELATAQPESFWVWIPSDVSSKYDATSDTMRCTSWGNDPPLVSHSTRQSAPFDAAASSTRSVYSGFALYPSKKCSASKNTRRPAALRNATDSAAIAMPSSSVVPSASVTWNALDLPTMQTVDVPASTRARNVGSSSERPNGLRVEPKATSVDVDSFSSAGARRKNSSSFGFDSG